MTGHIDFLRGAAHHRQMQVRIPLLHFRHHAGQLLAGI